MKPIFRNVKKTLYSQQRNQNRPNDDYRSLQEVDHCCNRDLKGIKPLRINEQL